MREWLMRMIAGRKHAYWLHPDVEREIAKLGERFGALGHGAVIALIASLKRSGMSTATFTVADGGTTWRVTAEKIEGEG